MAGGTARYDEIADFYDATAGRSVTDVATAALLELAGEVRGLALLDVACGQGRVADVDDLDGLLATVARVLAVGRWFVFSLLHPVFPRHRLVLEQVAERWPGTDWQQRLPGAAPVPLYLVARCLRR